MFAIFARMKNRSRCRRRHGLAPLEMVMAAPILLFIMALIINFGTAATWKVRGLSVARHVAWGRRGERSQGTDQRPLYWPPPEGRAGGGSMGPVTWLDDPRVDHPVVRGPMLDTIAVNDKLLDPSRGDITGTATMSRDFPLLTKGSVRHNDRWGYTVKARCELIDNKWRFHDMGLDHNTDRRTDEPEHDPLYTFAPLPSLESAYSSAIRGAAVQYYQQEMDVLDREVDFQDYPMLLHFRNGHSPDFHPRVKRFCTHVRADMEKHVQNTIDRIQGKPAGERGIKRRIPNLAESMNSRFKRYYQGVLSQIRTMLKWVPPHPNAAILQKEIPVLEAKIRDHEKFEQYLKTLP